MPAADPEAAAYAAVRPARVITRLTRNERRRKASERSRARFKEDDYEEERPKNSKGERTYDVSYEVEEHVATITEQGKRKTGLQYHV